MLSEEEEGEVIENEKEDSDLSKGDFSSPAEADAKAKAVVIPRQSLPRDSKLKHTVLGDKSVQKAQDVGPSGLNKMKSRHHQ